MASRSKLTCAGGAVPGPRDRLLHDRSHPPLVDAAHRDGAEARRPDVGPLGRVHGTEPDGHGVGAVDHGDVPGEADEVGDPRPRATARGMPWMFPDGLVSAVFESAWASNQMRPIFRPRAR